MSFILERIKNEPIAFITACKAILYMFMAFGLHITVEQLGATMVAVETVTMFFTRSQVTPNHIAEQRVNEALNTPVPTKEGK